jgi:hypothetical protein
MAVPCLLAELGLSSEDLEALKRQGFVGADYRHRGRRLSGPYFKLRWRSKGRQKVSYLGQARQRAEEVRAALSEWQRPSRLVRQLSRVLGETRRRLARTKALFASHLANRGLYLHGYTLRRKRMPAEEVSTQNQSPEPKGEDVFLECFLLMEDFTHAREQQPLPGHGAERPLEIDFENSNAAPSGIKM